jgi:hypothetical protein
MASTSLLRLQRSAGVACMPADAGAAWKGSAAQLSLLLLLLLLQLLVALQRCQVGSCW